jgi:hypothetical protein
MHWLLQLNGKNVPEKRRLYVINYQVELAAIKTELPRRKSIQEDVETKDLLIGRLRHDVIQLQQHLSEAMRRMRNGSSDDNIDRFI